MREDKDGQCFYFNEGYYIGNWVKDLRQGLGEHFYKYNDERYIGEWRDNMREGRGILICNGQGNTVGGGAGQNHYEGRFKEDQKHGSGILKVT
jgi:hypothetical protein